MVIDDLDLLCMPFGPYEAKPPSAADPDAVLAFPIMLQGLELIARWNPKEVQACGGVQLLQFPESDSFNVHKASHPPSFKQGLRIPATKTQDHDDILTASVINRKSLQFIRLPAQHSEHSPFGRMLQTIRENDFRAEALGFRTVTYRTVSTVLAALFATVAGALLALWLRYTGPDTTLSFEIMLDILLIVVIGGMGTLYGAVIGSVLFVLAQNYLQDLLKLAAGAVEGVPVLAAVLTPDRWLLWLGVLFVLSVYYFPTGVVGRLRARVKNR